MSIKIKELPELERPYEKLELKGEKSLSTAELLAIIIKTGTKEETAVQLAQRILSLNDSKVENLDYLQSLTLEELMKIKGIGRVKAVQIKAVCELSIRMFQTSNYKKIVINNPQDIALSIKAALPTRSAPPSKANFCIFNPKSPSKVNSYISQTTPRVTAKHKENITTNNGLKLIGTVSVLFNNVTKENPNAPSIAPLKV